MMSPYLFTLSPSVSLNSRNKISKKCKFSCLFSPPSFPSGIKLVPSPHTAQPYSSQTLPRQHPPIPPPPHPGVGICNLTTTSQPNQRVFRRMATSTSGKQVGKQVSRLPVVHSVAPQFLNFMISRVLGSSICEIVCLQVSNLFLLHILHSPIHQSFTHFLTLESVSVT